MKKINKPSKDLTKKDIMYIARDCIHFSLKVKKVLEKIKVSSISQNEIESKLKKSDISCYIDRFEDLEEIVAEQPYLTDNVTINFFPRWFDTIVAPKNYDGNWKIYEFCMSGCKDFSGVRLIFDKQKNSLRTWFFGDKWLKKKKREAEREAQLEKEREKLKKKEIKFNFTTPKKDWSIYGGWVNPFEPINKGRLGSTQEWRIEKQIKHYY